MYKVLYVDDEPDLLNIAKIFLEDTRDFTIATDSRATHALSEIRESGYDAVISDYQMPDMDGIAFLKRIREQYGDIPFILFTGRGREEVVIAAINNGADYYLQKGGDPSAQFAELAHQLRQAITRRMAQDELHAAYEQITASEEELRQQYDELAASEAALQKQKQQLEEIAGTIPGVIYQFLLRADGTSEFTYISNRAEEIFGIRQGADNIIEWFARQVDPRDRDEFLASVKESISTASPWSFEGRYNHPAGESIWFQGYSRPYRKGFDVMFSGILIDVTSRKKAA